MKSFAYGALIAVTALFAQVFVSVIIDIAWHHAFTLPAMAVYGTLGVAIFFLINGVIEEILRYIVVAKQLCTDTKQRIAALIVHGVLLGGGFWVCEWIFARFSTAAPNNLFAIICALCIHIVCSIMILVLCKKSSLPRVVIIVCATAFHVCGNLMLYSATAIQ